MEQEASQLLLLRFSLLLVLIPYIQAQQGFLNSTVERLALLDLRSSLGLRAKDWPIKVDPCNKWAGIRCQNGQVTEINISGFRRTRAGRKNPGFSVDALANFTFLQTFNASGFALPGPIPGWLGSQVNSLKILDLRSCSVTGAIPASIGNLASLNELYLSDNDLAGSIPAALGQLVGLSILDLSSDLLTGQFPVGLALLRNLSRLDLSSNYLSGPIPPSLANVSGLQFLDLSDNSFTDSIPRELGNLHQLTELNVSKNSLSSSLPVELTRLRNLVMLDVGRNELVGKLPDVFSSGLDKLEVVILSGNRFDGAVPVAFLSSLKLQVVDFSGNNFTGVLPGFNVSNSSAGGVSFNFSNNLFYGALPSSFGNVSVIDLSGNYLQGKVPDGIPSNLMLSENCLQDMPNQRNLEDCRLFYTERSLSFDDFGVLGPTQMPLPEAVPKRSKRWIYILIGVFGGVGFIIVLVLVIVVFRRKFDKTAGNQRGSSNVGPVPEGESPSLPKDPAVLYGLGDSFTYEQLFSLTSEFSEENLIKHGHSGDLFQGILEGLPVVVKKVNMSSLKKESYVTELELLSKCSHPRLVPLLGHCLKNDTEKFLVYKYMPNGDLASSFYREINFEDDGLRSLDWITRLKIAIGAAEALTYLHHECNPPLVHRDVQASSILLDDKFEVRLGSLSEVCAQEGNSHNGVLTRFLWKQQSFEAGPGLSSSATCAYDVYCFGKVLLELITGNLDISKSDDTSTREWLDQTLVYISIYDKELATKIVDPSLIIDEDLLEEVWAMAIVAKSCLNPKPAKRPPMKYILKALENPLKVVREENYNSGRLRTTSSTRSWNASFFGSWRHSSSDNAALPGHPSREGVSGLKQPGRVGSHNSGGIEHSSSNKRLSNEIFPEPLEMQELERQDVH